MSSTYADILATIAFIVSIVVAATVYRHIKGRR